MKKPHQYQNTVVDIHCGDVLVAKPLMPAGDFSRKVILITQHDELGTTGIILNKPGTVRVKDAFEMLPVDDLLNYGGNIESHLVTFLHNYNNFRQALPLKNGIYWGGSHFYLEDLIGSKPACCLRLKFFAGVCTWPSGTLELEILADHWWTTTINSTELFNDGIEDLRSYLLLRDNNMFGVLKDIPDPVLS